MSNFRELNLKAPILEALEEKGYLNPTPIQASAIPNIMQKRDFIGIAQTGTGKTAAFSLPILHLLSENTADVKPNHVRCLILTPTRELAAQIVDNIELYGAKLNLKYAVIFGGVGENPQIQKLKGGLDIVVATPGRLLDLVNQGYIKFNELEIFVLDEADRMLDMGFIIDVKTIIAKLPKTRQTLLFSATMPEAISYLAKTILNDPIKVEVTPQSTTVERIDQKIYMVERSNKPKLLLSIIKENVDGSVLVFFRTKSNADRINDFLEKNAILVETIHGDKSQSNRELALNNFRQGKANVLIATDIAARGIDIPGITHVINFDIPADPESYVHRIGRTGRAGKNGIAISFCDPTETMALKAIERAINYQIPVDKTHPFHGAEGVSGVRKLSSAKKVEVNLNDKKTMTNQEHKPAQGRKLSGANDVKAVTKAVEISDAGENGNKPQARSHTPREHTPREPREARPHNPNHKKPVHNHNRPKKGLIAKLVDKVKALLGLKKPEEKRKFTPRPNQKRRPQHNNNRSGGRR